MRVYPKTRIEKAEYGESADARVQEGFGGDSDALSQLCASKRNSVDVKWVRERSAA
jgi:hypothetical protein